MKISLFVASALLFCGTAAPSFAFDSAGATRIHAPVTKASCDTRNEDEQAQCASNCEDKYIRAKQHNMANQAANEEEKKACDVKCGCPQNSR